MTLIVGLAACLPAVTTAQPGAPKAESQTSIQAGNDQPTDRVIAERIQAIFQEIPSLLNIDVDVSAGVVRLSGTTADLRAAKRAVALVSRVDGVVTVENTIERDVSLSSQLQPALQESRTILNNAIALLPLLTLAVMIFIVMIVLGRFIAHRSYFWQRITPNAFIADLATTALQVVFLILALVLALNLLGATALLGAVLGSAGVIGLAVGFAVRDTIENYIASIMLSLRQPFRPKDHVIINNNEGHVLRLTSRATILMTLDGNHLRIPNAEVFKATILNYTTNPERRFEFELGVGAGDDPLDAIQTGLAALRSLDFVLNEPPPLGIIKQVGDSNIVICYAAWINQRDADFGKSRSLALAEVKNSLEEAGFGLPEPIYRLRFDSPTTELLSTLHNNIPDRELTASARTAATKPKVPAGSLDVAPERHLDEKVEEERRETNEKDLLNETAPTE